jgi:hypothetical protein
LGGRNPTLDLRKVGLVAQIREEKRLIHGRTATGRGHARTITDHRNITDQCTDRLSPLWRRA